MGSKPSKVTDVSLQIRPQQIANDLNSELEEKYNASQKKDKVIGNNVGGDGKAEEEEEEEDEDGGNDDETANKDAQDEDVLRQIDESKEICKRNVDIIRLEIDADGTDGHAIETEKIVKCSKIIGGLYFKLKKKKIAKRRIHRRAVALYLVESGGAAVVVNAIRKATSHWWRQQDTQDNTNNVGYYNIFYFATQILWNFSDASDQFAKCIADEGVIAVAEDAMEKEYQHAMAHSIDLKSKRVMKASLAITANCSFHELSRDVVKKSNMLGILGKINNVDFGDLDIYFVLIPAYIVNEEQSKELFHDEVAIGNIVEHVRKASKMKTRRSKGFSLHELCVLVGRLAVNDVNKAQLTKAGAEPILIQVVQRGNVSEKIAALEALKHLSFSDGKSILQDSIDIFEELLKSENKKIRKAAEGILWNINNNKSAESRVTGNKDPHVMISYQWGSQPEMIKIKDILKNAGYKVWMDIESMEGSTLEGMASAVENAAVVFMGISQKYKESANCRMEAEYAFQLKKEIIP
ncbi:uncharacterized protein [Ptychodera flava]|uniref:uncharacterized protein n=1 Tax=Ptychodera flava TaxID=63121 RepID=UPI003969C708